jgi:hypothetical protein
MATAHLEWGPSGGIQQEVKYKRESDPTFTLYDTISGSAATIDIPDLDDNTVYEFQVVTKCNFGLEASSSLVQDAVVTCPVLAIEQMALTLIITFHTVGGDIDKYRVQVYEMPAETLLYDVPLFPPFGDESVQFDGLTPDTYYKFRVIPSINDTYENATCEITERTLGCTGGYTLAPDGSYCYLIEEVAPDPPSGGTPENTVIAQNNVYTSVGSYIYEPGFNVNGTGTSTRIALSNTFWVNGPGDGGNHSTTAGPLNRSGLWSTSALSDQDIGFAVCIDLAESSIYYVGIAGDNRCRIVIDGVVIVDQNVTALGTQYTWDASVAFKFWHIYPVTLSSGPHIIELIGHNDSGAASLGAEVYHNTAAEIAAATSYDDLNLVFSTRDYRGQPVQLGSDDVGFTCPTGYSLAACEDPIVCRRILTELPS